MKGTKELISIIPLLSEPATYLAGDVSAEFSPDGSDPQDSLTGDAVGELVGAMHSFLYVDIHFLLAVLGENKQTTKLSCLVPETERESFLPNSISDLELCHFTSFCPILFTRSL